MWLTRVSVQNPYFAAVLMLLLTVLGLFAWRNLPVEEFPDIRFPVAVVSTSYQGASPEVVESDVTRPIEEAVNTINGVKHIRSYSFEGSSVVVVEFELSTDAAQGLQEVRDKVGAVQGSLRREVDTPTISQMNPNDDPLMSYTLSSAQSSQRELSTWADNVLKKRLQTVAGVGEVKLVGSSKREVRVNLDPYRLEALGLSVSEVSDAIAAANRDYPAGQVSTQRNELAVRVAGKLKSIDDFRNLVIASRDGGDIRLADLATVDDSEAERNSVTLIDGKPGVGLRVDLGAPRPIRSVDLKLVGANSNLQVLAANSRSSDPSRYRVFAAVTGAGSRILLRSPMPITARYVVVWFTRLPWVDGGYRGGVRSVVVRSG